ncbi:MAG TPA: hypothetical protein VFE88_02580 [Candidatus Nanoarchaeia archaeon]|nr:hypothetical protein [Candidatus Nanoarchaeia archaeon]
MTTLQEITRESQKKDFPQALEAKGSISQQEADRELACLDSYLEQKGVSREELTSRTGIIFDRFLSTATLMSILAEEVRTRGITDYATTDDSDVRDLVEECTTQNMILSGIFMAQLGYMPIILIDYLLKRYKTIDDQCERNTQQ